MTKRIFKIYDDSLQSRFHASRAKIQVYAGGFANGKTANSCIKAIELCKAYPGSNGLIARSTYPKLNDTIRKEFLKWCPRDWIKRMPTKDDNTLVLKNGTTINFRYVAQQSRSEESSSSNLLSATYDWIVVDQIEDPEFVEKDLLDLLGRLRGNTPYDGTDATMPISGPRWLILTCNPTRNWFYRKIIKPYILFRDKGIRHDDLFCDKNGDVILELFEGSTYENKDNLEADYIKTLEATYKGQMRDRYLLGMWAAYEGLVFPQYSDETHLIPQIQMRNYLHQLEKDRYHVEMYEAYDEGLAVPSCYLLAFVDHMSNVFVLDGWYQKELSIDQQVQLIKRCRHDNDVYPKRPILADPSIFKRTASKSATTGNTTAQMFKDQGIEMQRANNDKINGIHKVQSYLYPQQFHNHPLTNEAYAPYIYFAREAAFIGTEFADYYWKKDTKGEQIDVPQDKNDHAMDSLRYLLTYRPKLAVITGRDPNLEPAYMRWHEVEAKKARKSVRRAA